MSELPEYNSIQLPEPGRGVVRELVEVGPACELAVEPFHQVNLVLAVITGQFLRELGREVLELVPGYGRDRAQGPPRPTLANDTMPEKDKPVIDVCDMGFDHIQRQFQLIFQEGTALLAYGLGMRLVALDDQDKIIGIAAVRHRRLPLPVLPHRDGAPLENAEIPGPTLLSGFPVEVLRLQPLVELMEHDVR